MSATLLQPPRQLLGSLCGSETPHSMGTTAEFHGPLHGRGGEGEVGQGGEGEGQANDEPGRSTSAHTKTLQLTWLMVEME